MRAAEASNLETNVFDIRLQAEEVVKTANLVKDIANEVATGAVSQVVSLDSALDRSNQLTNSLQRNCRSSSVDHQFNRTDLGINNRVCHFNRTMHNECDKPCFVGE
jgi:hypothetical protein